MKYLVAIPIPEPWLTRLTGIKATYRPDGWRDTIDPHITVLAPDTPALAEDEAGEAFARTKPGVQPFSIRATRIERFSRRQLHTLVLRPWPETQLTHLFEACAYRCRWQATTASTKRIYVPHITIAVHLPEPRASLVQATLEARSLKVDFACERLALYAKKTSWPHWKMLSSRQLF